LLLALLPALSACGAPAAPAVQVLDPWCRPAAPSAPTAGCYLTLTPNTADRLLSVTTPLASRVQIHSTSMEGGVMRMEERHDGLPLPRNRAYAFKAGADHLMLIEPSRALVEGETVPLILKFEKAPTVTVQAAVRLTVP
jgi:copper(I)-binding protein